MRIPEEFTWRLAGRGDPLDRTAARVLEGDLGAIRAAGRVAVLATYDPSGALLPSVRRYSVELRRHGWAVVVVTASPESRAARSITEATVVIGRPNEGYDFGSWATALTMMPFLRSGPEVILTNDSMIGPLGSLGGVLHRAGESPADVWAATSSLQVRPHLQSYFLRFRPGVLADPALVAFFDGVRHLTNKMAIVHRYEIGLSRALARAGISTAAGFPSATLGAGTANPTLVAWDALLRAGYPFVKRTLLTDPRVRVPVEVLDRVVQECFGASLGDFVAAQP